MKERQKLATVMYKINQVDIIFKSIVSDFCLLVLAIVEMEC